MRQVSSRTHHGPRQAHGLEGHVLPEGVSSIESCWKNPLRTFLECIENPTACASNLPNESRLFRISVPVDPFQPGYKAPCSSNAPGWTRWVPPVGSLGPLVLGSGLTHVGSPPGIGNLAPHHHGLDASRALVPASAVPFLPGRRTRTEIWRSLPDPRWISV